MRWEALPENIRSANRMVADHFDVKLRAVGRRIIPRGEDKEAPLDAGEVEVLASMETAYRAATRRNLTKDLHELRSLTEGIATCRRQGEDLEMRLVCKDCGCAHGDVAAALERVRAREREYAEALEAWGRPAR